MATLLPRFEQFIRERLYLHNVSPTTVSWYTHNFKWMPSESPTEDELKSMVMRMREKGLRATGCNSAIRSVNAYLKWSGAKKSDGSGSRGNGIADAFRNAGFKDVSFDPVGYFEKWVQAQAN